MNKFLSLSLSVGGTLILIPILGFDTLRSEIRYPLVFLMYLSGIAIFYSKKLFVYIAQLVMWFLILWELVTMVPDRELAQISNEHSSQAYLITRLVLISTYALINIWILKVFLKTIDQKN